MSRNQPRDDTSAKPTLEVTSLGSGSCGNALLVRSQSSVFLVDCGVGVRRMTRTLSERGLDLDDVGVVLVSHEHNDHMRELARFTSRATRILSTAGTASAARIPSRSWEALRPHRAEAMPGAEVIAIPVSHDAREPCGFLLRCAGGTITVLTDVGSASQAAAEAIAESDLVVLEANHDEGLVRRGPYPAHLQRRILSDTGHLSNDACATLLIDALRHAQELPTIWLAHLSEINNRPQLATQTVRRRLTQVGLHLDIETLPRRACGPTWRAGQTRPGVAQLALNLLSAP